ncbi:C2h2 transcription factor [Echinococcus multilocularis]|uniref:C2h2 transcription factor n=1 Tax=Echinococcus multilocularis TaxID=6211 RepID=A0A0S4MIZ8_ECHMU|nr:C2h2 transcription factor [Echinococcus multilocularis]
MPTISTQTDRPYYEFREDQADQKLYTNASFGQSPSGKIGDATSVAVESKLDPKGQLANPDRCIWHRTREVNRGDCQRRRSKGERDYHCSWATIVALLALLHIGSTHCASVLCLLLPSLKYRGATMSSRLMHFPPFKEKTHAKPKQ